MFSFDLSTMLDIASQLFNSLVPIVGIVGGISLGIGLVGFVLHQVKGMVSRGA